MAAKNTRRYFSVLDLFPPVRTLYDIPVPRGAVRRKKRTGVNSMYMYRVETYAVRNAEAEMNKMAMEGWRVISVCPNQAAGYGVIVTYEKAV